MKSVFRVVEETRKEKQKLTVPPRSGPPAQPEVYGEFFLENGRWYGTFRRGHYMFPVDEVSLPAISPFAMLLRACVCLKS